MDVSSFLSVKDFFNYYFAGFLWILEIIIAFLPLSSYQKLVEWLEKFQTVTDKIGVVFTGVLLIVFPYIIGFVFTPIGMGFTKLLRSIFGDPKIWITDYSKDNARHKGKRLAQTKIRLIIKKLKEVFGEDDKINESNLKNWFFAIRDYVINNQGEAASHAVRAQDLVNFTESIILPLPIICITIGAKIYVNSVIAGLIFGILGLCFLCLLSYRYLKFRTYWVKHIYNTFLVIASKST